MNNMKIEKSEIINKIKKFFPQFKFDDNTSTIFVYENAIVIPDFDPNEKYNGLSVGSEMLLMIVEHILWKSIAYEKNINLDENFLEIVELTNLELQKLIEAGIYE